MTRGLSRASWLALLAMSGVLLVALQAAPPAAQESRADVELLQSVQLGADWLVRHQDSRGFWDSDGFESQCRGEACGGKGGPMNDVGVTGLGLLALTRAWQASADPRVGGAIERAAVYLGSVQDPSDGCFGSKAGQHFMYGHALATLALVELHAVAPTDARAATIRRALDFIVRARNPYKGWRYSARPDGDNDASVTSMMEIVLGRAIEAGIAVDAQAIDDGLRLLDELTDPMSGRTGYHERGTAPARQVEAMERWPAGQSESMTAAALHARATHDVRIGSQAETARSLALLEQKQPHWDDEGGGTDFYYWFHGTEALRAAGGAAWTRWRETVVRELRPRQRKDGHAAGSFDPLDPWSANGGRVYSTAINVLTLAATLRN